MRRQEGIDDVDLREAVNALRIGDSVRLTFRRGTMSASGETLPVLITGINGQSFQGKLARKPAIAGLAQLAVGSPVAFTPAQIHSVVPKVDSRGQRLPQRRSRK
jgi:hypothetical protein